MRTVALLVAFLLPAVSFGQNPASQTPATASISGVVKRSDNDDGAAGVRVTLTKWSSKPALPEPNRATPPPVDPAVTTGDEGKFHFAALEPGAYKLILVANGFVRQEYGQAAPGTPGAPIELTAGKVVDNLVVRITATGAVRGRVWNADKEPAPVVVVRLFRFVYGANGERTRQYWAATRTDDRGEFRMTYITPGRYYVSAGATPGEFGAYYNGISEAYPITYYPGVPDLAQALPIDVSPGAEIAVELSQTRLPAFRLRGRVIDSRIGRPPSSVAIALTTRGAGGRSFEVSDEAMRYNGATGAYELHDILPGTYLVTATWGNSILIPVEFMPPRQAASLAPNDPATRGARSSLSMDGMEKVREGVAYATLTIGDRDIESFDLNIGGGGDISGRVRADGGSLPDAQALARVTVLLKPTLDGAPIRISNVYPPASANIIADGTFRFNNATVGEYRVAVEGLDSGLYLKEARFGANDALNRSFAVTPSESNVLELVIGSGAPQISGAATDERLIPTPGAQIALIPERNRDRVELFRTATAGPEGRFTITNVVPGDYKLYAWEVLEPFAYFDPSVLQRDESRAKNIRVSESANQNLEIRVIPAP